MFLCFTHSWRDKKSLEQREMGQRNWALCVLWPGDVGMFFSPWSGGAAVLWEHLSHDGSALPFLLFLLLGVFKGFSTSFFIQHPCSVTNFLSVFSSSLVSSLQVFFPPVFDSSNMIVLQVLSASLLFLRARGESVRAGEKKPQTYRHQTIRPPKTKRGNYRELL